MRKIFVAGNWKMHKTIAEAKALVQAMLPEIEKIDLVDTAVCPPYLAIPAVVELCRTSPLSVWCAKCFLGRKRCLYR